MRTDEGSGRRRRSAAQSSDCTGSASRRGSRIGPAFVSDDGDLPVPEYRIARDRDRGRARRAFADAVALSLKQLRKLKAKAAGLPGAAAEEIGYLLDAHLAMLANSRLVRGVDERIGARRINAERAVQIEIERDRRKLRRDGRRLSRGARSRTSASSARA